MSPRISPPALSKSLLGELRNKSPRSYLHHLLEQAVTRVNAGNPVINSNFSREINSADVYEASVAYAEPATDDQPPASLAIHFTYTRHLGQPQEDFIIARVSFGNPPTDQNIFPGENDTCSTCQTFKADEFDKLYEAINAGIGLLGEIA